MADREVFKFILKWNVAIRGLFIFPEGCCISHLTVDGAIFEMTWCQIVVVGNNSVPLTVRIPAFGCTSIFYVCALLALKYNIQLPSGPRQMQLFVGCLHRSIVIFVRLLVSLQHFPGRYTSGFCPALRQDTKDYSECNKTLCKSCKKLKNELMLLLKS